MSKGFEFSGNFGKEFFDNGLKVLAALTTGSQAIAAETVEYMKKTLDDGTSAWQDMLSAKSVENALEIQRSYAKSSYEGFVSEAGKLNHLFTDLAKDACQPIEDAFAKAK